MSKKAEVFILQIDKPFRWGEKLRHREGRKVSGKYCSDTFIVLLYTWVYRLFYHASNQLESKVGVIDFRAEIQDNPTSTLYKPYGCVHSS